MSHPTLLSSTLRRLTVGVSLLTSALFAILTSLIVFQSPVLAILFFFLIFWVHCYLPGYVSYHPTTMSHVRGVVTTPRPVRECVVCGESDTRGVVREFSTQFVAAGIPLATTERGENEYCVRCHAVEFSPEGPGATDGADSETAFEDASVEPGHT